VVVKKDGTFRVDLTNTVAGGKPFDEVTVEVTVPGGEVKVKDVTIKACVNPGENCIKYNQNAPISSKQNCRKINKY
jgi:hypothetical protein